MTDPLRIGLLNDNPAPADLLGFADLVQPVVDAIGADHLDPVSIGLHGPWGSGKSTLLGLVSQRLQPDGDFILVPISPWEYDDATDVKELIIGDVLAAIDASVSNDVSWAEGVRKHVAELARRVSWSRVGMAVAKGAVTMSWNPGELLDAFSLMPEEPRSLSGFKEAFSELVAKVEGLKRVVVLVDDLDRCLPMTVVETLEAIKLFLSVEKMVFVLACDKELVRDAIAAHLPSSNVSGRLTALYLDKLIQLPVHLPSVTPHDAEAYVGLLLASSHLEEGEMQDLVAHCTDQRRKGVSPLLAGGNLGTEGDRLLRLASQISRGLGTTRAANPREIKRFINALAVRQRIAQARDIDLQSEVLCKLMILEDRHPAAFTALLRTTPVERPEFLEKWEAWAKGATAEPPDEAVGDTLEWAATDPSLADAGLGNYLTLAASFSDVPSLAGLPELVASVLVKLLSESEGIRGEAYAELGSLDPDDAAKLTIALRDEMRRSEDIDRHLRAAVELVKAHPSQSSAVGEAVSSLDPQVWTPAAVVDIAMSGVAQLEAIARAIPEDERYAADVRTAATEASS
jgi:hypothetical protein